MYLTNILYVLWLVSQYQFSFYYMWWRSPCTIGIDLAVAIRCTITKGRRGRSVGFPPSFPTTNPSLGVSLSFCLSICPSLLSCLSAHCSPSTFLTCFLVSPSFSPPGYHHSIRDMPFIPTLPHLWWLNYLSTLSSSAPFVPTPALLSQDQVSP